MTIDSIRKVRISKWRWLGERPSVLSSTRAMSWPCVTDVAFAHEQGVVEMPIHRKDAAVVLDDEDAAGVVRAGEDDGAVRDGVDRRAGGIAIEIEEPVLTGVPPSGIERGVFDIEGMPDDDAVARDATFPAHGQGEGWRGLRGDGFTRNLAQAECGGHAEERTAGERHGGLVLLIREPGDDGGHVFFEATRNEDVEQTGALGWCDWQNRARYRPG